MAVHSPTVSVPVRVAHPKERRGRPRPVIRGKGRHWSRCDVSWAQRRNLHQNRTFPCRLCESTDGLSDVQGECVRLRYSLDELRDANDGLDERLSIVREGRMSVSMWIRAKAREGLAKGRSDLLGYRQDAQEISVMLGRDGRWSEGK